MYHNRITHDGLSPAPAARRPAPDIADDATQRERRMHAAGVGLAALCVVLPALLALMHFARMPVNPDAAELESAFASSTGRAFVVATWIVISMLGALAGGWVLAGAVRARGGRGAVRMVLAFGPAAVVGAAAGGAAALVGVDGDSRLLIAAQALFVAWCALTLWSLLRVTRGYDRRHERALGATTIVLLLITVPLAQSLWITIALAFTAWALLATSTQWHPRQLTTAPIGDAYAQEQFAHQSPPEAEHLRFPLHQRR